MLKAYRTVALSFGYAESNTTSWLIYHAEAKNPTTRREALESLVNYLWNKFYGESLDHHDSLIAYRNGRRCCQDNWLLNKYVDGIRRTEDPTHCEVCGTTYPTWKFHEEEWKNFLQDIHSSYSDSYGDHVNVDDPYGWSPWMYSFNVLQHQMVIIGEQAEKHLTHTLYQLHPELLTMAEDYPYYMDSDYQSMIDESTVFNKYGMVYVKPEIADNSIKVTQILDYPNGGQATLVDGILTHIKYNTGDEIWLEFKEGNYNVTKVRDYSGHETTSWHEDPYNR